MLLYLMFLLCLAQYIPLFNQVPIDYTVSSPPRPFPAPLPSHVRNEVISDEEMVRLSPSAVVQLFLPSEWWKVGLLCWRRGLLLLLLPLLLLFFFFLLLLTFSPPPPPPPVALAPIWGSWASPRRSFFSAIVLSAKRSLWLIINVSARLNSRAPALWFEFHFFLFFFWRSPASPSTPASFLFTSKRVLRGNQFRLCRHINMYINGVQYSDHRPWHIEFQYAVEWPRNKDAVIASLRFFVRPNNFRKEPVLTLRLPTTQANGLWSCGATRKQPQWWNSRTRLTATPSVSFSGAYDTRHVRHWIHPHNRVSTHLISSAHALLNQRDRVEHFGSVALCVKHIHLCSSITNLSR